MEIRASHDIVYELDKIVFWLKMFSCCFLLKVIMSKKSMANKYRHAFCFGR